MEFMVSGLGRTWWPMGRMITTYTSTQHTTG